MSLETVFERLVIRIEEMEASIRRMSIARNNLFREGEVVEVDYDNGTVVVEAMGIRSSSVPWVEQSGAINEWTPPSVGQRMVLVSPDGDMGMGFALKGGFTDNTPAPHNKGSEKRVTIGGAVVTQTADGMFIQVGGAKLSFTEDGMNIDVGGSTFSFTGVGFEQSGGVQKHNDKNVGSDHIHGGVERGGSNTSGPAN
ncbi:phage baseplate assembly protein V [Pseudochrobactrum asaccharolyticum]|uniref:Phage baseplate assembly protein V n=1 Tax=Pseudochrobactrum asaccharolyticum TaxID=354351 RepID=A0A366DKA3_9HYPH|nr:phage baseplate assembly protein V [Pseudochrobactrum asaccharolyticum]RBO90512.1 phage baseplate assembly protein V [Pseudochrobactrum asaccharolyticum]